LEQIYPFKIGQESNKGIEPYFIGAAIAAEQKTILCKYYSGRITINFAFFFLPQAKSGVSRF